MEDKPKFSKLAIASFILSLSPIIIVGLGLILDLYILHPEFVGLSGLGFLFSPIIDLVALILSIISLKSIKKYNLRGKALARVSLTISILMLLLALWFFVLRYLL
ncbi:hypothetical protein HY212_07125 [Candidatus Pacearchaeota archaeon]|nr:hypothetical protein [Candidatus Pacearchaeota archaeon]